MICEKPKENEQNTGQAGNKKEEGIHYPASNMVFIVDIGDDHNQY